MEGPQLSCVALFVDLDNIRIGMMDRYGCHLHPEILMEKAKQYGDVVIARAYADYSQGDIKQLRDKLIAAGIDDVDVPARIVNSRTKDYVDFYLLMDIYDTLLDRPDISTYVLATGDDHFTKIAAKLRTRHDKRVVILGVPGSISQRLRDSASAMEELQQPQETLPAAQEVVRVVADLERRRPYVTRKYVVDLFTSRFPGLSLQTVHDFLNRLIRDGVLLSEVTDTLHGQKTVIRVNPGSPSAAAQQDRLV